MDTFYKTLPRKIATKKIGVYYKEIEKTTIDDKGKTKISKPDKVYYIRYKNEKKNDVWLCLGKYSSGIREVYCNQKRIEALNQIRLGEQPEIIKKKQKKNIVPLSDLADKYFESIKDKNKDYKNSLSRYNIHIKPNFKNRDIISITKDDIEKLQKDKQKKLSDKTVNHIIQLFGTIINHSIKYGDLTIPNPVSKVKKLSIDNARNRFLNTEEIKRLLNYIKDDAKLLLFVKLSLCTGGRIATITNIKKVDISIEAKTVNLKDLKSNSSYIGSLDNNDVVNILEDYIAPLHVNDFLFANFGKVTIQKKLKVIFDELFNNGLDLADSRNRVVTHTLRHTFASHLAINGTPIYTIQNLMNHKTISMTMRYAKLSPDSGHDEVRGLYK